MTDTGWTFEGRRVIESEYAPNPGVAKHWIAPPSDYTPFLSRIVNTCDLHGAMLGVSDPVQNMRAACDYHARRSVHNSKERTMTTDHIGQLAQWYADAERVTKTNLPNEGDTLIYPRCSSGYIIESGGGGWTPELVHSEGEIVRILARAPKPKPAWHDAPAVIARTDLVERQVWERDQGGTWCGTAGDVADDYELHDVTPLIEAKVTDEMIDRVFRSNVVSHLSERELRGLLTDVLGIEAE